MSRKVYLKFKRLMDLTFASAMIILLHPLLLLVFIVIKTQDSELPVFFLQTRLGINLEEFTIIKFRTMQPADNQKQGLKYNSSRTNLLGKILRSSKVDELPQLLNILRGEMSFIGPRPELPVYSKYINDENIRYIYSVPPGLADLATISFRSEESLINGSENPEYTYIEKLLPVKARLSTLYVKHQSLVLDSVVLLSLPLVILYPSLSNKIRRYLLKNSSILAQ